MDGMLLVALNAFMRVDPSAFFSSIERWSSTVLPTQLGPIAVRVAAQSSDARTKSRTS